MFWRRNRVRPYSPSPEQQYDRDRRGKLRFPIERELRFKVLKDATLLEVGTGHTSDIGSGGVLFSIDRDLVPGSFVQLSISWPVLLEGDCPVRLVIFGRVLRCADGQCACTINKYEFRTQARALDASRPHRDTGLERWADTVRRDELKTRIAIV
jgi:hypothetical protein